jgi:hypothetical protein
LFFNVVAKNKKMARRRKEVVMPHLNNCGRDIKKNWYVEYSIKNPQSGEMERIRHYLVVPYLLHNNLFSTAIISLKVRSNYIFLYRYIKKAGKYVEKITENYTMRPVSSGAKKIIDPQHKLVLLSDSTDWQYFENEPPRPKGRGIVTAIYVVDTPQAAGNVPKQIQILLFGARSARHSYSIDGWPLNAQTPV